MLCQPRYAPGIMDPNIQRIPNEKAPLLLAVSTKSEWLYDQYYGQSVYYKTDCVNILEVVFRLGLCHLHDIIRIRMSRTSKLMVFFLLGQYY